MTIHREGPTSEEKTSARGDLEKPKDRVKIRSDNYCLFQRDLLNGFCMVCYNRGHYITNPNNALLRVNHYK